MKLTPNILENLEMADIVRGSSEDFEVMFHQTDPDKIYRSQIAFYTRKFIYTRGADPIELRAEQPGNPSETFSKRYEVSPTPTVSTIGAGDNFNAGFVFGLLRNGITRSVIEQHLTEQQWDQCIACAQKFSAKVCQSLDNYVDVDFVRQNFSD